MTQKTSLSKAFLLVKEPLVLVYLRLSEGYHFSNFLCFKDLRLREGVGI